MIRAITLPRTTADLFRSLDDAARSGRWSPTRKAAALQLLDLKVLTVADLDAKYGVQPHEVEEWRNRARRFGAVGLAVTRLQEVGR